MRKKYKYKDEFVEESSVPIELTIITKLPEKWVLIDSEYLQIYIGKNKENIFGKKWQKIILDENILITFLKKINENQTEK
jgi:hypothetical protein